MGLLRGQRDITRNVRTAYLTTRVALEKGALVCNSFPIHRFGTQVAAVHMSVRRALDRMTSGVCCGILVKTPPYAHLWSY